MFTLYIKCPEKKKKVLTFILIDHRLTTLTEDMVHFLNPLDIKKLRTIMLTLQYLENMETFLIN